MRSVLKSKYFNYINLLFIMGIFILGFVNKSVFEVVLSIGAALFWFIQIELSFSLDKNEDMQRKQCKGIGFFLLIPTIVVIVAGVSILFLPYKIISPQMAYITIALSATLVVCSLLQLIATWKNTTLAARFLRWVIAAGWSAPLSLVVVLIMHIAQSDDTAVLSTMSTGVFGSVALLVAVNLSIVSICGYKSTKDSINAIRTLYKNNKLIFTQASIIKDAFLVVGKLVLSIISLSFFMLVNAMYSAGMGSARFIALKMHTQDKEQQITSYRRVGTIISAASICYVLYSVRLFFGGTTGAYSMNIALVIALYTFVEFGINIREAVRLRKSKALEAKALRAISFAATLLCFVLTQTAIMSFANDGDNSFSNALSGVIFGGIAAFTGIYVIVESFLINKSSIAK